jgi:hypothetical protein
MAHKGVWQVAGTTHLPRPMGAGAVATSLADRAAPVPVALWASPTETLPGSGGDDVPIHRPPAECDVFEAVSFEDFWPWMLGQYLLPTHLNTARSMCHAMGDRTFTITTLAEDTYEFTRLLLHSDLMDAVLRKDEVAMGNLVLSNTIEQREIYRLMLPEEVHRHITQTESFCLLSEDEALGLTGVTASLNSCRLPPVVAGELTLAQLQQSVSLIAEILHREATRDRVRLHSLLLGEEPKAARLLTLEAWRWTRSCRPTTNQPTTWLFSMSWPPTCQTILRPISSSITASPGSVWRTEREGVYLALAFPRLPDCGGSTIARAGAVGLDMPGPGYQRGRLLKGGLQKEHTGPVASTRAAEMLSTGSG